MEWIMDYQVLVIVGICLCIGYIVKKWTPDSTDKLIPTICGVVGLLLAIWINWGKFSPEVILQGLFSGLSATGLHQAFKQLIENGGKED